MHQEVVVVPTVRPALIVHQDRAHVPRVPRVPLVVPPEPQRAPLALWDHIAVKLVQAAVLFALLAATVPLLAQRFARFVPVGR